MRRFAAILLAAALSVGLGPAAFADERLFGRWDEIARTKGGIGSMLYLGRDGASELTLGVMADFEYETRGSRITLSDGGRTIEESEYRIEGERLVLATTSFARSGARAPGQPATGPEALLGSWNAPHHRGGIQVYEFLADKRLLVRIPMRTDRGRFSVRGNALTLESDATGDRRVYTFRVQGERLMLTAEVGREQLSFLRTRLEPLRAKPEKR